MAQFSVNTHRFDPYKNFKFRVKWDGRYVAGVSKVGALKRSTEMVEHLFLWIVMIGASYGFKHGVHLGVDILMRKLPSGPRKVMSMVAIGISLVFTAGMTYLSVFYVHESYKMELTTVDMEIPQWIPHLALPFGFTLISIRLFQVGWLIWQDKMINVSHAGEPASEHLDDIID